MSNKGRPRAEGVLDGDRVIWTCTVCGAENYSKANMKVREMEEIRNLPHEHDKLCTACTTARRPRYSWHTVVG